MLSAAYMAVAGRSSGLSPSLTGLVLTYALSVVAVMNWAVRMGTEVLPILKSLLMAASFPLRLESTFSSVLPQRQTALSMLSETQRATDGNEDDICGADQRVLADGRQGRGPRAHGLRASSRMVCSRCLMTRVCMLHHIPASLNIISNMHVHMYLHITSILPLRVVYR